MNACPRYNGMTMIKQAYQLRLLLSLGAVHVMTYFNADANLHAKKLFNDVMVRSGYNRRIRPVLNQTDIVHVGIGASLSQLIDMDERNQHMTVNIWLMQQWEDPNLTWKPDEYANVSEIYVPSQSIWHPEIVLYNNADGQYTMTEETKARLRWNGMITWKPPARLSCSCTMEVRYFPFDNQRCELEFGSWTYNQDEVVLDHLNSTHMDDSGEITTGMDLSKFYRSFEWDVLGVPARYSLRHYAGDIEPFTMWTFQVHLRRKYGFYVVNLVIPLVSHAVLTILTFYLPSDSKQKIPLSITILLSLTVYFLLLTEIIPSTSLVLPLLGEYLLFTLILVTFSLLATVLALNAHFRSSATHIMPNWVRKVFLYILPRVLHMKRPKIENSHDVELKHIKLNLCTCSCLDFTGKLERDDVYQFGSKRTRTQAELSTLAQSLTEQVPANGPEPEFAPMVTETIKNAIFIANHLKSEDDFRRTKEDWKYVALVIDRIFLLLYIGVCTCGTLGIICNSPTLYEDIPAIVE